MPFPISCSSCASGSGTVATEQSDCADCNSTGIASWNLGLMELMARYQYVFGLRPIGPHRPLADRLLSSKLRTCHVCDGSGLLPGTEPRWYRCAACEAIGAFWTINPRRVESLRTMVLAEYPDAAAPTNVRFLSNRLGLDPATGCVVNLDSTELPVAGVLLSTIKQQEVERAFARARDELGSDWQLKGRGHCRRVTIRSRFAGAAGRGAHDCWQYVAPLGFFRRLFPLPVVARAAELLGVPADCLVSREFV